MKAYKYLFYKLYKFMCFLGNEDFYPEIKAYFLQSMCLWANILTLISAIEIFFNQKIFSYSLLVLFAFLCLTVNYFITLKKDKYVLFIEEFNNEASYSKTIGSILVIIYFVFSIVMFIYFVNIVRNNLI